MRELVFETSLVDTDEISDCLIGLGALSVTVEDAQADAPNEHPIFGEPGMATDIQAWPTSKVIALLDINTDAAEFWQEFCSQDDRFNESVLEVREISDKDWVSETQRQFAPLTLNDRLWVGPHWTEPPAGFGDRGIVIRLDPGMAFGTGSHATSQLCLESLLQIFDRHTTVGSVLDMGCGSGILAIAAAKLGAAKVHAVDIDPIAVDTARQNAAANHAVIQASDAGQPISEMFDIVMANILAQPLKVLAPMLSSYAKPGGALLLSGILARQTEELLAVYRPLTTHLGRLSVLQEKDGWACIGTLGS